MNGVGVVNAGTYLCQILICISGKVIEIMLIDNYYVKKLCSLKKTRLYARFP